MIKICAPATPDEFGQYYQLRWEILRKPWNQPKGSEVGTDEDACIHAMARTGSGEVQGVARLQFNTPTSAQVRYVAVANGMQGKGVGKALMLYLEKIAKEKGAKEVVLDARENALEFYKALQYQVIEPTYLLFGEIQHYRMRKEL
jgi:N-acetylglutamate synthase-like GNAT family acetyltransferase